LLAARELRGKVIEPIAEADEAQRFFRFERVLGDVGHERDIFARRQTRDQVVELKYEAHEAPPVARERVFVGCGELRAKSTSSSARTSTSPIR
jgi:hypothetical protein